MIESFTNFPGLLYLYTDKNSNICGFYHKYV